MDDKVASFEKKCIVCTYCMREITDKCHILKCSICETQVHRLCGVGWSTSPSPSWRCESCRNCDVCGGAIEAAAVLRYCGACDRVYHVNCIGASLGTTVLDKCSLCLSVENKTGQVSDEGAERLSLKNNHFIRANSYPYSCRGLCLRDNRRIDGSHNKIGFLRSWSVEDVANFLMHVGMKAAVTCISEQKIDGVALLLLRRSDVLRYSKLRLGPALKLYKLIYRLQCDYFNCCNNS